MKRYIIIFILMGLFFAGCEKNNKNQEKDYSNYLFTDVSWTRDAGNDIETIVFKSNGRFVYYCSCGNSVNDSDLCESYEYNDETKEIILDCFEETEDTVTNIKVINSTESTLELDFNGDIRIFEKTKE